MKSRIGLVIGWICALLVAALNAFALVMKYVPVAPGSEAEAMLQKLGLTVNMQHVLGVVEGITLVLFLIPRTSTVGFVLMVGYMGGALATNLTHGFSNADVMPLYITFVLLTISAYFRNPELLSRLTKKKA